MRSSFAPRGGGFELMKTPSHRQQVARRRMAVVCGVLALALASGLIGTLAQPHAPVAAASAHTGPFSYFPSE
jgi:hypothetical protein